VLCAVCAALLHSALQKSLRALSPTHKRQPLLTMPFLPPPRTASSAASQQGGGNRVSEDQIKEYLRFNLGEAPMPEWGLPDGWGSYLSGAFCCSHVLAVGEVGLAGIWFAPTSHRRPSSIIRRAFNHPQRLCNQPDIPTPPHPPTPPPPELFTWATGRLISKEEAMACARRQPGRSWEAVTEKLYQIGVHCWNWPVPLTLDGCRNAAKTAPPATPAQQLTKELLANGGKRTSSGSVGAAAAPAAAGALPMPQPMLAAAAAPMGMMVAPEALMLMEEEQPDVTANEVQVGFRPSVD